MNRRDACAIGVLVLVMHGVCLAATPLTNGVTVTDLSGDKDSESLYEIEVPPARAQLEVRIWGGAGDCDLYVRRGAPPTRDLYDYGSWSDSNDETVTVGLPGSGKWYIMLHGFDAYNGVSLQASYPVEGIIALANTGGVRGLGGGPDGRRYFSVDIGATPNYLSVAASSSTGMITLYLKKDAVPTPTSYDYCSASSSYPSVSVSSPSPGTWYIMFQAGSTACVGLTVSWWPIAKADLEVDTIRLSPKILLAGEPGQRLTTSCHVSNRGSTATDYCPCRVYLSADEILTESDHLLGTFKGPYLLGGRWKGVDLVFTLPVNIPPGSYYVVYSIDADDQIPEATQATNVGFAGGLVLIPSLRATCPHPPDKSVNVPQTLSLRWNPGRSVACHDLYFGEDAAAVANASVTDLSIYRDRLPAGTETYPVGPLEWGKTYYWRIDEVNDANSASPWKGDVWSFTTADFLVVDDFESYTAERDNRISETWQDGRPYKGAPYPSNGTGSKVGHMTPPFVERKIVHSGLQAMPVQYDNVGLPHYSEIQRVWTAPQDWTANGMNTLVLYVRGEATNKAEPLYVVIRDAVGRAFFKAHPNASATKATQWLEWPIPLSELAEAGLNTSAIQRMYIGVGDRDEILVGKTGVIYIDDIRVIRRN